MILDPFGKPVHPGNRFISCDWLKREMEAMVARRAAGIRVYELRASLGVFERATAITVRLPRRYTVSE